MSQFIKSSLPTYHQVTVEGAALQPIIFDKLMPALLGIPHDHGVLAMLTLCAIIMRPNIEPEKLHEVVMKTSEALVLNLSDDVPAGEAN